MKENKNKIKKDLFNGVICKEGNRQTAGITLIALVITIIVLIILAGVTLNMLLGENGIINRTKTAKEQNDKATATETMNLKITNVQMSKYAEKQRMPTLKELADNFCEDDDFQYVQETSEVASLTKITSNNPTSIYTKLKAYPYEFEINSSLQLASIDGVKVASNDSTEYVSKAQYDSLLARVVALENNSGSQSSTSTTGINYSTSSEQVIGTWIDGTRPVYQKTYLINSTINVGSNWTTLCNYDENIELIIEGTVTRMDNNGTTDIVLGLDTTNKKIVGKGSYTVKANDTITIRYIKTIPTE